MNPFVQVVIGKNFGDEGKGQAADYFCSRPFSCVVIKHNGGAQSGHTVYYNGSPFVFHQLSSGSFRGAATFWAETYYPDLYKLNEEAEEFSALSGFVPEIYCDVNTPAVYFGDVIINRILETGRGDKRHGSCGMGINESFLRTRAGFRLTVYDFISKSEKELFDMIDGIRRNYTYGYLRDRGITVPEEYAEILSSDDVIYNAVAVMKQNAKKYVKTVFDTKEFLHGYQSVVFESGQGLLLDSEYVKYAPHLTSSRTGLFNPALISEKNGLRISEVIYVTRTYVTRHGNGPLPHEFQREIYGLPEDGTNRTNEWQGRFRYAAHDDFTGPVSEDLKNLDFKPAVSLFVTHLNETDGKIILKDGPCDLEAFIKELNKGGIFTGLYLSDGKDASSVVKSDLF